MTWLVSKLPQPPPFENALAENERLVEAELLLKGQIYGPESIAIDQETGLGWYYERKQFLKRWCRGSKLRQDSVVYNRPLLQFVFSLAN
ncbi:hypothetical protein DICVIV_08011 [Dictyocaulus viviparus]|uniref:Uncharacterized protein n=1 Tax=Dictyocaulus viviparus TaxID=29172 RepID=A0A0D8XMS3_DICVI|nr:hypothetical protein DICVIV_08011 [Dictyocaulus viviparus]